MKGRYIIMLNFVIGFFVGPLTVYLVEKFYVKYKIHKMYKETFGDVKPEDININDL